MNARGEYGNQPPPRYDWSAIGADARSADKSAEGGWKNVLPYAIYGAIGTVLWIAVSKKMDAEYDRGIRDGKALARGQDPRKYYER